MTLQELASAVAKANPNVTPDIVDRFVNAFFASVTESLIKDGNVKINGFGTFVHTAEPKHQISFIPSDDMADTVNTPFSMFEPEELSDDVTDEMLENNSVTEKEVIEIQPPECQEEPSPEPTTATGTAGQEPESVMESAEYPGPESGPELTGNTVQTNEPTGESDITPSEETEEKAEENDNVEKETVYIYRNIFPWWYALIAGIVAGVIIGGAILYTHFDTPAGYSNEEEYTEEAALVEDMINDLAQAGAAADTIDGDKSESQPDNTVSESESKEPEIREVKPAEPEVITETVSSRNYLTTMAKRHYGKDVFWVYIYLENADKLKHPDRIRPNTVVVIPPASKYGIDKNDPKSVASAKQKGTEIYSKYK